MTHRPSQRNRALKLFEKLTATRRRRGSRHRSLFSRKPFVEQLEDRRLLALSGGFIDNGMFVEVDEFDFSLGNVTIATPFGDAEVQLGGPTIVHVRFDGPNEGDANDDDGNGLDEVETEMVQLNLSGVSPMGAVNVRLNPALPSTGQIEEQENLVPGTLELDPFVEGRSADSYFDLHLEIIIDGNAMLLYTPADTPKRLEATINGKPPISNDEYRFAAGEPTQLVDENGVPQPFFLTVGAHEPNPPTSSIHGFKYEDLDYNGVYDEGVDPPFPGALFELTATNIAGQSEEHFATTNPHGKFWFSNLPPSNPDGYTIREQVEFPAIANPLSYTTPLDRGQELVVFPGDAMLAPGDPRMEVVVGEDLQFANVYYVSIHGFKYEDVDANGDYNKDIDGPLPNVEFRLSGTDGMGVPAVGYFATTDDAGEFSFSQNDDIYLFPGTYTVTETVPDGWVPSTSTSFTEKLRSREEYVWRAGAAMLPADSPQKQVVVGERLMFGNYRPASIHGLKFDDINANGLYEPLLDGVVADVEFTLTGTDGMGNPVNMTTVTGVDGQFGFVDLVPGTYTVTETLPPGTVATTDTSREFELKSGEELVAIGGQAMLVAGDPQEEILRGSELMFGNFVPGSIHGFKFNDENMNGRYDAGSEPPVAGVEFTLTGVDGMGTQVMQTTTTGSDGRFEFVLLKPGIYTVTETVPAGTQATTATTYQANLASGEEHVAFDGQAMLEGTDPQHEVVVGAKLVFGNVDTTGRADAIEVDHFALSLGNIELIHPDNSSELIWLSGPTTVNVFFEGPNEGDANDDDGNGQDEVQTEIVDLQLIGVSSLGPLEVRLNPNMPSTGQIEELVNNNPGLLDLDPFAPGDADSFFDLNLEFEVGGMVLHTAAAKHMESVIRGKPPVIGDLYENAVEIELLDAGGNPTGFRLGPGGHEPNPLTGSIHGFKFEDRDYNGDYDPAVDDPLAGVTFKLTGNDIVGNPVERFATSDADGEYWFTQLLPSDSVGYSVTEMLSSGLAATRPTTFTERVNRGEELVAFAGQATLLPDQTEVVIGEPLMFGNTYGVSIHGFKYEDVDANGLYDSNVDRPLRGVEFTLSGTDGMGAAVNHIERTNSGGEFWFATQHELFPGNYTLAETVPSGWIASTSTSFSREVFSREELVAFAGQANLPPDDPRTEILLGAPLMFGNYRPASIHGFKFNDVNADGAFDPNIDQSVSGVEFTLTGTDGAGDPVNVMTTTGADGRFGFTDLRPGNYTVTETVPAGTEPTTPVSFTTDLLSGEELVAFAGQANLGPNDPQEEVLVGADLMFGNLTTFDQTGEIEVDEFTASLAEIEIIRPSGASEFVTLFGPSIVYVFFEGNEGDASDDDGNGLDEVQTRLVHQELRGESSLGPVVVRLDPTTASLGQIEELVNNTPGVLDVDPFAPGDADSIFDVFFEIEIGGQVLHGATAKRMETVIAHKPPAVDDVYVGLDVIDLLDENDLPTGFAMGTVLHAPIGVDYGDAPDATGGSATGNPYPTLLEHDGARHVIVSGAPFLGIVPPDPEFDGQPNAIASGDDADGNDDEDGLTAAVGDFSGPGQVLPGESFQANVTVNGTGLLNAWVDWNGNGSWSDAGEQLATDVPFATGPGGTTLTLNGFAPTTAVAGDSYIRLRVSTDASLAPDGLANDGEVEDFALTILDGMGCSLVVTHTGDGGPGSLRDAILCANSNAGLDTIRFNIDGAGPHTIGPQSPLPKILDAVTIDGTTEPDYAGSPVVELDGTNAGTGANTNGLLILAGPSTVRGLAINRFDRAGIQVGRSDGHTIEANHIGTDTTGTADLGNRTGIRVSKSSNNMIGTSGAGNLISGNTTDGVRIVGTASTGNLVRGNLIGVDASGAISVANRTGVAIVAGRNNTVGGSIAGEGNIISGNAIYGVLLRGDNNRVEGNRIGTDVTGNAPLPNTDGVLISAADGNVIGGTADDAGNQISGNLQSGILLAGARATGNFVEGNLIGTNADGTAALGNRVGVSLAGAPGNTIGGVADGAGNTIAGNIHHGVLIEGDGATNNRLEGNQIGTNLAGDGTVGNLHGVTIDAAPNNTIGGTDPNAGNVISGNDGHGIRLLNAGASGNFVAGNMIGMDATGTTAIPNTNGVFVAKNAHDNTIAINNIAANRGAGVFVPLIAGTGNSVSQNSIHNNGGLGIDLGGRGRTANDPGDPDTGGNNLQNFPVIDSAIRAGGDITITGTLDSTPDRLFTLEFYSTMLPDDEGAMFLGSSDVSTDSSGNLFFAPTYVVDVPAGSVIVATATDDEGSTSEFSAPVTVVSMLLAAGGEADGGSAPSLTHPTLAPIVDAAVERLAGLGLDASLLSTVDVSIADLPGAALGAATDNSITIDVNAAGHGWFVDATPLDDSEFTNRKSEIENQKSIDLLTAVMHELSHVAGLDDLVDAAAVDDLMFGLLGQGVRKTSLEASLADEVFSGGE